MCPSYTQTNKHTDRRTDERSQVHCLPATRLIKMSHTVHHSWYMMVAEVHKLRLRECPVLVNEDWSEFITWKMRMFSFVWSECCDLGSGFSRQSDGQRNYLFEKNFYKHFRNRKCLYEKCNPNSISLQIICKHWDPTLSIKIDEWMRIFLGYAHAKLHKSTIINHCSH